MRVHAGYDVRVLFRNVPGVLLDAPFDDLVPLAERIVPSMLPKYFLPFTEVVLRRHYNLNVAAQLSGAQPGQAASLCTACQNACTHPSSRHGVCSSFLADERWLYGTVVRRVHGPARGSATVTALFHSCSAALSF